MVAKPQLVHRSDRKQISERGWREEFLTNLLTRHGVPYISSRDVILTDRQCRAKPLEEYYLPNDNHPNAYQTGLIAQELKSRLLCGTFGMSRTTLCGESVLPRLPLAQAPRRGLVNPPSSLAPRPFFPLLDQSFWTPRNSRRTPS